MKTGRIYLPYRDALCLRAAALFLKRGQAVKAVDQLQSVSELGRRNPEFKGLFEMTRRLLFKRKRRKNQEAHARTDAKLSHAPFGLFGPAFGGRSL